jgi:hypothetical protein
LGCIWMISAKHPSVMPNLCKALAHSSVSSATLINLALCAPHRYIHKSF